jgi:hypothetical protein
MYNGQFAKSFALIFAFALLIWGETTDISDGAHAFLGLAIFAVYAYMIFDAYKTARAKELGEPLPDPFGLNSLFGETSTPVRPAATAATGAAFVAGAPGAETPAYVPSPVVRRSSGPAGALLLIGIGVLFLLGNLDIFDYSFIHHFWPVIIIAVGVWMFWRRRPLCNCQRCQSRCLMGPAMVVTVGVLMLLAETTRFGFHYTWPVFLLVVGGVRLAQANASTEGHIETPPVPPAALAGAAPQAPSSTNSEVTNA